MKKKLCDKHKNAISINKCLLVTNPQNLKIQFLYNCKPLILLRISKDEKKKIDAIKVQYSIKFLFYAVWVRTLKSQSFVKKLGFLTF